MVDEVLAGAGGGCPPSTGPWTSGTSWTRSRPAADSRGCEPARTPPPDASGRRGPCRLSGEPPPAPGQHPAAIGVVVTSHDGKGPHSKERYRPQILPRVAVLEVPTPLAVTHVQPLPGGKVLIACARTPGTDNAEVRDGNGRLEHAGLIGDAIEHLLTTPRAD
jgi:hypothetical protein